MLPHHVLRDPAFFNKCLSRFEVVTFFSARREKERVGESKRKRQVSLQSIRALR